MSVVGSIGFGIGFMVGVTIFVILLIIISKVMSGSKSDFTPEMFEKYKLEIIAEEKYEELKDVDSIIQSLIDEKPNKKLLTKYEIKKDTELLVETKKDGTTAIKFGGNPKIVLKTNLKSKNKK